MPSGPEHYREAERHAGWAKDSLYDEEVTPLSMWNQQQAQVHATLALTAGTVSRGIGMTTQERADWIKILADRGEPS